MSSADGIAVASTAAPATCCEAAGDRAAEERACAGPCEASPRGVATPWPAAPSPAPRAPASAARIRGPAWCRDAATSAGSMVVDMAGREASTPDPARAARAAAGTCPASIARSTSLASRGCRDSGRDPSMRAADPLAGASMEETRPDTSMEDTCPDASMPRAASTRTPSPSSTGRTVASIARKRCCAAASTPPRRSMPCLANATLRIGSFIATLHAFA
jgi:hypothetical protein